MRFSSAFGIAAFVLVVAGCQPQDPKSKLRDSARRYNEAADLLVTIKDANSLEAAKPKLKKFFAWAKTQNEDAKKQANSGRAPTQQEIDAGMKAAGDVMNSQEFKDMMSATGRYMGEVMRCQLEVPAFRDFYQQEMGTQPARR